MDNFDRVNKDDYYLRNQMYLDDLDSKVIPLVCHDVLIADPGNTKKAIPITKSGVCAMTSVGAETRTLAIPTRVGVELTLIDSVHAGNIVLTAASPINQAGNNTVTFGAVNDLLVLRSVYVAGAYAWRVIANDGAALSTV